MNQPSYLKIREFCYRQKKEGKKDWRPSNVKVSGEPFPWESKLLLEWLVEHKIVRRREKDLLEIVIKLRHSLSHLEFAPILTPSPTALRRVANQINKLFYEKNSISS